MPQNSKWILMVLIGFASITIPLNALVLIADPYSQFSLPSKYTSGIYKKIRFSGPGLARNAKYEIAVLGASAARPYSPEIIAELTKKKAINLAIDGGTAFEQKLMAEAVLKQKPYVTIVWQQAWLIHKWPEKSTRLGTNNFPYELYTKNPLNIVKYLNNPKSIYLSINSLLNTIPQDFTKTLGVTPWEKRVEVDDLEKNVQYYKGVAYKKALLEHPIHKQNKFNPITFDRRFAANVTSVVTTAPDARFIFILPPYPSLMNDVFFKIFPNDINYITRLRSSLETLTRTYKNVTVIDFQDRSNFLQNKRMYKDLLHFKNSYASVLLEEVFSRSNMLRN
ncbi:hypothetical protein WH96_20155 [Kiloniella spongiae]|uniref:Uncharacterized protein n=1 Tax=Kiloniella spongiae TaxID=1489064 RepID=A0A0H2M8Z6_9PROT|nr:SGNH/GDSL hydrolase family protein [Kiloniella spongiae]KLN58964.1 hypothetical protein WH96_20155 [Kiloniella spongiae]